MASRATGLPAPADIAVDDVEREGVDRDWVVEAVAKLHADAARTADTHLHRLALPGDAVHIYLKDEAGHPTGSLKHRLARSLILYGLCDGRIGPGCTLVEASSGSTAISEAYFARLLGLPFVAVVPQGTSPEKVALIEAFGGRCHFVASAREVYDEAAVIARQTGGCYLDQFTFAERATDWRGNNNIAESMFRQLRREPHPEPAWVVVGAGTGGTSATIGRYLRFSGLRTKLAVVDPEGSAFFEAWRDGRTDAVACGSRIEGIGRPRMEASFIPTVVDRMMKVPDAGSLAAMAWLTEVTGHCGGPSTGTNVIGALLIAHDMVRAGQRGSIVTLQCDAGHRYGSEWMARVVCDAGADEVSRWRHEIDRMVQEVCAA